MLIILNINLKQALVTETHLAHKNSKILHTEIFVNSDPAFTAHQLCDSGQIIEDL